MKKCSLERFRKKLPSDLLLIWQICSAMSANDLINFWDKTIFNWQFSGHFEFCNIYLTREMQNDWTMNIKQNVMSYTRITHGGCLIIMASAALRTTLPWFKHN